MICSRNHHLRIVFIALTSALLVISSFVTGAEASAEQASSLKIEGTVRDSLNSPIPGASVHVENSGGSISQEAITDAEGKFLVVPRDAGTYVLRIQKPGFRESAESIIVPPKVAGPLTIVLLRSESQPVKNKSSEPMQFSDKADFTIAGITDWTAAGGHGSDVNLRTSESLAKDTRGLAGGGSTEATHEKATDLQQLLRRRDQLHKMLANGDRADLHRELGDVCEQMNDSLTAVHEYELAARLDPTEQNYFAWGAELLLHRAIQPAVEVFTKGTAAYPSSERMLAGLGAALYASGLYPKAADRLCAASDLNPADSTPYLFLGKMTLASAQPLPCAERRLARFSHDRPDNALANYYYALALWKKNGGTAPELVESLLKNSINIDPKFTEAYLQLGIVYSAQGETQKAVGAFQKATAANPNLAEAHFRLGQTYKKMGEASKARQEFQAYEQVQNTEAAAVEQQRREIQQFVVVFKDQPQTSPVSGP
jgi:tetratricopeptide (TPR) repeat protein